MNLKKQGRLQYQRGIALETMGWIIIGLSVALSPVSSGWSIFCVPLGIVCAFLGSSLRTSGEELLKEAELTTVADVSHFEQQQPAPTQQPRPDNTLQNAPQRITAVPSQPEAPLPNPYSFHKPYTKNPPDILTEGDHPGTSVLANQL